MPSDAASIDAVDVALAVASAVEAVGGEYFIGGSLANSLQGEPRATDDIDKEATLAGYPFKMEGQVLRLPRAVVDVPNATRARRARPRLRRARRAGGSRSRSPR